MPHTLPRTHTPGTGTHTHTRARAPQTRVHRGSRYSTAQQGPLAGPEERVGRKRHILLSPRGPRCCMEGCKGPGVPRGLSQGCSTWAHPHTHTPTHTRNTSTCPHVHAANRCPTPRGLLTMVTEWPPLSSSHPPKVSRPPVLGDAALTKAQARWPGRGSKEHSSRSMPATLPW